MRGSHTTPAILGLERARKWLAALLLLMCVSAFRAQTLARHNWAGSGLSAEPWWRSAVFYRINPGTFQDSDGDGKGDLRGIAQRMLHLQSLSVDAVVLQSPFDESGFDDLVSEASSHHIRLLVSLSSAGGASLANAARSWLTRGCAGIWLQVPAHTDSIETAMAIQTLRKLTDSFPGQRVLVEDTSADPAALALPGAQLVTRSIGAGVNRVTDALSLRVQINQLSTIPLGSAAIVLRQSASSPETEHSGLNRILAAALFLSRGATMLAAGQEIGFDTTCGADRVMQWTPANVTRTLEPEKPVAAASPPPRRPENDYGAYVPFVPPTRKQPASDMPDLNALPGFSLVAVATVAVAERSNVARDDADPNSLLNFYRKLSQLHHENTTLRTGTALALDRDAENTLVWLRIAPKGARASSAVVIAANLADSSKTVSLLPELGTGSRSGDLLPLLSSSPRNVQVLQRPTAITLAPWSVVVLGPNH